MKIRVRYRLRVMIGVRVWVIRIYLMSQLFIVLTNYTAVSYCTIIKLSQIQYRYEYSNY